MQDCWFLAESAPLIEIAEGMPVRRAVVTPNSDSRSRYGVARYRSRPIGLIRRAKGSERAGLQSRRRPVA